MYIVNKLNSVENTILISTKHNTVNKQIKSIIILYIYTSRFSEIILRNTSKLPNILNSILITFSPSNLFIYTSYTILITSL